MNPSGDDKKYKPIPKINPKSDKPTGSEEEEKEPEKNPSEKPKEEEKGGFVEWFWTWYKNNLGVSIPLTYICLVIGYMVFVEIWQQIGMYKENADSIYLDFALKNDDSNIKPVFGLFKGFTKKGRFSAYYENNERTITYRGLDRLKVNFVAAATLAKYKWVPGVGANS